MIASNVEIKLNSELKELHPNFKLNGYGFAHMKAAQNRYMRFLPYIASAFPETAEKKGVIESAIKNLSGNFFLKDDRHLPVANCIQGRGIIHAVLKEAEITAQKAGILNVTDNYSIIDSEEFRKLYGNYSLIICGNEKATSCFKKIGSRLGFNVLSESEIKDTSSDSTNQLFISEEDMFFGYSTAALRLKIQLFKHGFEADATHPVFVFIYASDTLAAYGITFGLKQLFGNYVHCFFINPSDNNDNFGNDIASGLVSGSIFTPDLKTNMCLESFVLADTIFKSEEINEYMEKHDLTHLIKTTAHVMWEN